MTIAIRGSGRPSPSEAVDDHRHQRRWTTIIGNSCSRRWLDGHQGPSVLISAVIDLTSVRRSESVSAAVALGSPEL